MQPVSADSDRDSHRRVCSDSSSDAPGNQLLNWSNRNLEGGGNSGVMPMSTPEESARRLLDGISESLDLNLNKLARVAGQFITPSGNQVYPVRLDGRTVYVTVPED